MLRKFLSRNSSRRTIDLYHGESCNNTINIIAVGPNGPRADKSRYLTHQRGMIHKCLISLMVAGFSPAVPLDELSYKTSG